MEFNKLVKKGPYSDELAQLSYFLTILKNCKKYTFRSADLNAECKKINYIVHVLN